MPGEIRHQLSSCWLSFQMASFDDSRKLVLKICEKVQQPAGQEQTGLYKDSNICHRINGIYSLDKNQWNIQGT